MSDPSVESEYPSPGILDSRRLLGPNLFGQRPGVVLEVVAPAERLQTLIAAWTRTARELAHALGWGEVELRARPGDPGAMLYLGAPVDVLLAATEVNEQAWAAAELGEPVPDDVVAALTAACAAEREAQPRLAAAFSAALERGVPATFDDDGLLLGSGAQGRGWPLGEIPAAIPWDSIGRVPISLVTGSNGKTTTTRLVAAMWRAAGRVAGYCCSDGVWVDDEQLESGDYSGPGGARTVLRDRRVQAAVLETARGGILRRGLGSNRARAAAITNVSADHFGEYGIGSLGELARAKAVVASVLGADGCLVLNADDPVLVELGSRHPGILAWASRSADNPQVLANVAGGGSAAMIEEGRLRLHHDGWHDLGEIEALPLTLHGAAHHNVQNVLNASLLAAVSGVPVAAIRDTLARFGTAPRDNPGRLQVYQLGGVTVLVDYAHNPEGLAALCRTALTFPARRRVLVLGQAGDRGDEHLLALVRAAWEVIPFDRVVLKEMASLLRGRLPGEVTRILAAELRRLGLPASRMEIAPSELEAFQRALAWARPGDLVVAPVHAERPAVLAEIEARGAEDGEQRTEDS